MTKTVLPFCVALPFVSGGDLFIILNHNSTDDTRMCPTTCCQTDCTSG